MSLAGTTIENYHIHSKLGSGGMGVVYKARDTSLNRLVALKFLPARLGKDEKAVERFLEKVQITSRLNHPNLCKIYDIQEMTDGQICIVMAYYDGQTLAQKMTSRVEAIDVNREAWGLKGVPAARAVVSEHRPDPLTDVEPIGADANEDDDEEHPPDSPVLPQEQAISIARQIGEGLAAIHAEGIVHLDLKPTNVMITKEGRIVLLDFGLTELAGGHDLSNARSTTGTADYMAPEQVKGERVDHQTDIWAAGSILYELISGRKPFPGEYDQAVIHSIINTDPADVDNDAVRPILQKALVKDKLQRYGAAGAFVADLKDLESAQDEEVPEVETESEGSFKKLLTTLLSPRS